MSIFASFQRCPQHTECIWYTHNPDNVGRDLGVGDGIGSGVAFAHDHRPMSPHDYPVSDGRGDYYALGFMSGAIRGWCPDHEDAQCLGTWRCTIAVAAVIQKSSETA